MLAIVLSLVTLVTFRSERKGPEQEARRKTALALAQAKEALIGNAAINSILSGGVENPGRLPCPNIFNNPTVEGNSTGNNGVVCNKNPAGIPNNMGRFPWKSLIASDLRDGASERLWYVIDPAFIDNGKAMNSEVFPTLTVNGVSRVAAVIIAPGPALGAINQQRDTVNQEKYTNYLESYTNALAIADNSPTPTNNDRIITITARELFSVVTQRMAREFAKKLELAGFVAPYPAAYPFPPPPHPLPLDVWDLNEWYNAAAYTSISGNKFTLQFTNCSSVFTVIRSGSSNVVSRDRLC